MKTTLLALTAAALASAVAAAPAQAAPQVPVSYADLDIHSDAGAAKLATRVQAAVTQVCIRSTDIHDIRAVSSCRTALLSDVAAQLGSKGVQLAARG